MLKGKNLLEKIINQALLEYQSESDEQKLAFDNTELKAFLATYKNPSEDIKNLSDEMLSSIKNHIDTEDAQKKFAVSIKYIRGIAQINNGKENKIAFSDEQKLKLVELEELINKVIEKNEYLANNIKKRSKKQIEDYRHILVIINNNQIFTAEDYEIVEKIVREENPLSAESNLDIIFSYLNEHNSRKFKDIRNQNNVNLNINEANDIFESFIRNEVPKTETKLVEAERTQKVKEIIATLGYNYDDLEISLKLKLIAVKDLTTLENTAKELINKKTIQEFKPGNIYSLIYILINSNPEIISTILELLETEYNITPDTPEFKKIINTSTTLFTCEGLANFKKNISIFYNIKIPIKKIIKTNIALLTANPNNLKIIMSKLKKKGANISDILDKCPSIFESKRKNQEKTEVEYNLDILEMYGFDLESFFNENNPSYSVLCSKNLDAKLDQFIEVGLNDYIHEYPSKAGTAFKSLIIKRVYYAFKNNLSVWSTYSNAKKKLNKKTNDLDNSLYPPELVESSLPEITHTENEHYNTAINESWLIMSDFEIENIKSAYPVMELIDEGYRAAIYTNAPKGLLKRKTELVFGTQIISRPKVFKVFRILIDLKVPEKEALLYAITFNTLLEPHEYDFIKEAIKRIGVDKNNGLFKTI
ncbi:MAG: hypothetical protein PHX04_06005 [Bacilli bacterium]|nr:hypothetical protein [Bacilli bacterium]